MPQTPDPCMPMFPVSRDTPHPDQERHRQMNLLISRLDEQQRRWYAALESSVWAMAATYRWHGSPDSIRRPSGVAAAS